MQFKQEVYIAMRNIPSLKTNKQTKICNFIDVKLQNAECLLKFYFTIQFQQKINLKKSIENVMFDKEIFTLLFDTFINT